MRRDVKMFGLDLFFGTKAADVAGREQERRKNTLLRIRALWE
jgi:hypothetical protein